MVAVSSADLQASPFLKDLPKLSQVAGLLSAIDSFPASWFIGTTHREEARHVLRQQDWCVDSNEAPMRAPIAALARKIYGCSKSSNQRGEAEIAPLPRCCSFSSCFRCSRCGLPLLHPQKHRCLRAAEYTVNTTAWQFHSRALRTTGRRHRSLTLRSSCYALTQVRRLSLTPQERSIQPLSLRLVYETHWSARASRTSPSRAIPHCLAERYCHRVPNPPLNEFRKTVIEQSKAAAQQEYGETS